jgi:serine/threonine-protein kinase
MPSQAVQQLLEQGQRTGLFSAAAAQDLIGQVTPDRELTTDEVADQLVARRVVTAFQAEQLLAGRADECIVAGRYRILEKLGAGGMGTVYKAQDTKLDRFVALKVLPAHLVNDPGAVARFQREAKALAKVSHPAIVQAHDTGEDRGQQFLVMEYVEGTNLSQMVKEQGRIPPTLAADYVYQAAQALEHAHDKGLVHRDLKPSNLLLTPDRQIKILDLGLARFLQDQIGEAGLTREGTGLGTPDYMAPEQFGDARHVDRRADIYSLGCTMYNLLTGHVPFPGSSLAEKAQAHEENEPPLIEQRCPEAPAGLVLVVQHMMAKRPADRFQTAGGVAAALAPYVASSSGSLPQLRRTASWHESQLSFTVPRPPLRRLRWALAGVASVTVLALALYFGSGRFRIPETASDNGSGSPAQPEVVIIPNGFTVAKDGTGQFTTIAEALAKVEKPGTTIRVLDDATYSESLSIGDSARQEGLTLVAARRATIALPPESKMGVFIADVPHVKLRGFRVRMDRPDCHGIVVSGVSPGVILEGLECVYESAIHGGNASAIWIWRTSLANEDDPVTVQVCKVAGVPLGIAVEGSQTPTRRLIIRDCEASNADVGIFVAGLVSDVQITGNRIWSCRYCIYFQKLPERSTGIVVANNTMKNVQRCLVVDQPADGLQGIVVRNNLVLAERGPDLAFIGKDQRVLAAWKVEQNWRRVQPPAADDPEAKEWIPAAKDRVGPITLLSLDSTNPVFLRPAKDSPLATDGAGKDDPTLPTYVGAVPPEGVKPWDWQKTWKARQKGASPKDTGEAAKSPGDKGKPDN